MTMKLYIVVAEIKMKVKTRRVLEVNLTHIVFPRRGISFVFIWLTSQLCL